MLSHRERIKIRGRFIEGPSLFRRVRAKWQVAVDPLHQLAVAASRAEHLQQRRAHQLLRRDRGAPTVGVYRVEQAVELGILDGGVGVLHRPCETLQTRADSGFRSLRGRLQPALATAGDRLRTYRATLFALWSSALQWLLAG